MTDLHLPALAGGAQWSTGDHRVHVSCKRRGYMNGAELSISHTTILAVSDPQRLGSRRRCSQSFGATRHDRQAVENQRPVLGVTKRHACAGLDDWKVLPAPKRCAQLRTSSGRAGCSPSRVSPTAPSPISVQTRGLASCGRALLAAATAALGRPGPSRPGARQLR